MWLTWIDSFLIAPFAWPASAVWGMWLGCSILAAYCVVLGEVGGGLLFLANRKHHIALQDAMTKSHNLSVQALHQGDKASYVAINKQAHEQFGRAFFAQAGLGMSSLLPVPFALWWLSLRFEGIEIYAVPWTSISLGYVFIFLISYIVLRIWFSRWKPCLPFLGYVYKVQQEAKAKRGEMRSFFAAQKTVEEESSSVDGVGASTVDAALVDGASASNVGVAAANGADISYADSATVNAAASKLDTTNVGATNASIANTVTSSDATARAEQESFISEKSNEAPNK